MFNQILAAAVVAVGSVSLAFGGERWVVCVSNEKSGDVTVIDGTTREVAGTVKVGNRPRGVHGSPDGNLVYAAVSGFHADGIAVVDLGSKKLLRMLESGKDPEEFDVSADGSRIYVSNEDASAVSEIDTASGKVIRSVKVGTEPEGVRLTPDGKEVWVTTETDGGVSIVDAHQGVEREDIKLGGRPRTVTFTRDGRWAFVPSETEGIIRVLDARSRKVERVIKCPAGAKPMGSVLSGDEKTLYVSMGRAGTVCVVDVGTGEVTKSIQVGTRPWGVALSPDGKWLFTANGPSNDVSVVDVGEGKEVGKIKAGVGPWGVVVVKVKD